MPSLTESIQLLAGAGLLPFARLARACGVATPRDGWRRAAGLVLAEPRSTFELSAFGLGLDAAGDEGQHRCAAKLHEFLTREAALHIRIVRRGIEHDALPHTGPSYTLDFQPWVDGPARFVSPEHWTNPGPLEPAPHAPQPPDQPLLNLVVRISPRGFADLWVRVNHVGADGVPVQEMLTRLEKDWGVVDPPHFPAPEEFESHAIARPRADVHQAQCFIDFAPLLAWRKSANAGLPAPMTVGAAILWNLARHPAFAQLHAGTTVEVEASGTYQRGVGVVVVRPADYFSRPQGLRDFVTGFNARLEATRTRQSPSCTTLDTLALLPAPIARTLLRHALDNTPAAFGSIALTMLKDAKVFGAPFAQRGHPHGFLAVGSLALPTRDGRRVGCITIKGPHDVVRRYPALLREALAPGAIGPA